jgi:hypothetical protein
MARTAGVRGRWWLGPAGAGAGAARVRGMERRRRQRCKGERGGGAGAREGLVATARVGGREWVSMSLR